MRTADSTQKKSKPERKIIVTPSTELNYDELYDHLMDWYIETRKYNQKAACLDACTTSGTPFAAEMQVNFKEALGIVKDATDFFRSKTPCLSQTPGEPVSDAMNMSVRPARKGNIFTKLVDMRNA